MTPELRGRVWKLILNGSLSSNRSTLPLSIRSCSFSSIDIEGGGGARQQAVREEQVTNSAPDNAFARSTPEHAGLNNNDNHDIGYNSDRCREDRRRTYNTGRQNPPDPIPNRPLRGEKPSYEYEHLSHGNHGLRRGRGWGYDKSTAAVDTTNQKRKPVGLRENRTGRQSPSTSSDLSLFEKFGNDDKEENMKKQDSPYSQPQLSPFLGEKQDHDFLEKFKLGFNKEEKHIPEAAKPPLGKQGEEMKAAAERPHPPQDADAIFKKMKETGLIPNAVAMLDGLCKDGLVQEAMKLFGLMREKGTIPEVVIYTAVVEGFCKAQKLDDAKRIFKKMQNNGISPNAFSYTVLIQGLYKGKRLEDALDFCVEMLEAGHSLNLTTFAGLVDGFCREKGLEEAQSIIGILRQKGFSFDEKAVREYLDKKGPFLPLVWEAIVGKKSSHISF